MADDSIRILIVSNDLLESLQREIMDILALDKRFNVVGVTKQAQETISLGNRSKPHIFLVSDVLQDNDIISLIRQLTKSFPASACILFSENDSPVFLRQAMLAGIRQFIKRPINADELHQKLHLIYRTLNPIIRLC